jgi:hypothetical protein
MASIKMLLKYFLLTLSRRLAIDFKSVKNNPIDIHINASIKDSYEHFSKYFDSAMLFSDQEDLRMYSISKAKLLEQEREGLFMELGVFKGRSLNLFADSLREINKNIFGFDAFLGIEEDWIGHADNPKGFFSLGGKPPKVRKNVILYVGWVQDTLAEFLEDYPNVLINFIHFDMDTYTPTKFALENLKSRLTDGTIILFDELYGYPNWRQHEYRALLEVFDEDEYEYIGFSECQVAIRIKNR